jgi:hypothetical protein
VAAPATGANTSVATVESRMVSLRIECPKHMHDRGVAASCESEIVAQGPPFAAVASVSAYSSDWIG